MAHGSRLVNRRHLLSILPFVLAACGSRSDIDVDLVGSAAVDASIDATNDARADAPVDASSRDTSSDAPTCHHASKCSIANCPDGCCSGDTCVPGADTAECGSHGEACSNCTIGGFNECDPMRRVCLKPVRSCSECSCCDESRGSPRCRQTGVAGSCVPFECEACGPGLICQTGICAKPCGLDTCRNGCCLYGQCLTGNSDTVCGGFGEGCRDCTLQTGDRCVDHACLTDVTQCYGATCANGCCAEPGGKPTCIDGISARACGSGGNACVDCVAVGLTCDIATHKCTQPLCSQ
jgi:hypothetical protein